MPLTLSLLIQLLVALSSYGGAGVVISLGLDALRRRSPLPGPDPREPRPAGLRLLYLRLLWTPVSAFFLAVGLSALAATAAAALSGQDGWAALDQAIYNGMSSQLTWAARWLALNPRKRSMPELGD